ncbi:MAG TPA: hypothetical protein GX746_00405 [Bacteroidales bacterium]|nr:hypothetical protein [Bacteroidales bacterium]
MKKLLSKYWIRIIGILLGALGGYIYYIKIGCNTGTCPITSDPTNSMLYGALMGFLLFGLFITSKKVTAKEKLDKK